MGRSFKGPLCDLPYSLFCLHKCESINMEPGSYSEDGDGEQSSRQLVINR